MYRPKAAREIPTLSESEHYWKRVMCRNCGLDEDLAFKKGDKIEIHACPECENVTLERF